MIKFIEKHLVLSIILTTILSFGTFAAVVGYMDDPTTIVSRAEVDEWSRVFAETLRTLEFDLAAKVQSKIAPIVETRSTTEAASQ